MTLTGYLSARITHWLLIPLIVIGLSGCAISVQQAQRPTASGPLLLSLAEDATVDGPNAMQNLVVQTASAGKLPEADQRALLAHPKAAAQLLWRMQSGADLESALTEFAQDSPAQLESGIFLALTLFPDEQYSLLDHLMLNHEIDQSSIEQAALLANLDPAFIFPPTAAQPDPIKVTPLFHSLSITLTEPVSSAQNQVRYRLAGQDAWRNALPLRYDPVVDGLSGSIVRLAADTDYEIEIQLNSGSNNPEVVQLTARTRAETPPIDPAKVYRLADIYRGGQLNLVQLGIKGTAEGWAKIIGDDNTIVRPSDLHNAGIYIGGNSYVMFENVKVEGGRRFAIHSNEAHHLWFKGCELSGFGRPAAELRNGIAYESATAKSAINYDAGFFLKRTGQVVIEDCEAHSPAISANHWGDGHPKGASAVLLLAKHPNDEFSGGYVIRNNRFYGSAQMRFNDVIESRSNGRVWGGLVRDSAIYGNYLAYANDDIIEIDGGQHNVLIYDNEIEQGFVGISATPNMQGPSYIFNNYIHNLGDERGQAWAAIKLGGLMSAPEGQTHVFDNLIDSLKGVGIAGSNFQGDDTFWADIRNNIILLGSYWKARGLGIYDTQQYSASQFINNYLYNFKTDRAEFAADLTRDFHNPELLNQEFAEQISAAGAHFALPVPPEFMVPNFSRIDAQNMLVIGRAPESEADGTSGQMTQPGFDSPDLNPKDLDATPLPAMPLSVPQDQTGAALNSRSSEANSKDER